MLRGRTIYPAEVPSLLSRGDNELDRRARTKEEQHNPYTE